MNYLKISHKPSTIKIISILLLPVILLLGVAPQLSKSDPICHCQIFSERFSRTRIRKVYRDRRFYRINFLQRMVMVTVRVLLIYLFVCGFKIPKQFGLDECLISGILICSVSHQVTLVMSLKFYQTPIFERMQRLSQASQNLSRCLLQICIAKVCLGDGLPPIPMMFFNTTEIVNTPRITLLTDNVKVEDLGDAYRITVREVIWAEIKKEQKFELRVVCVQLRQARDADGKPLLMLKEIAQAFDLPCLQTISKWDLWVQQQGTFLVLDFERKHRQIINELKYDTKVLTPEVLKRIQELCKENPFLTYIEIRDILFQEGITTKLSEVSVRHALERIPFYLVRDSLKKQLQKRQLTYRICYLSDLLRTVLQRQERGEQIPKAELIRAYHVIEATSQPPVTKSPRKQRKIQELTQKLFSPCLAKEQNSETSESHGPKVIEEQTMQETSNETGRLMLNLRLYVGMCGSFRSVAGLIGISPSTSYQWVALFAEIAVNLSAFIGVVRFSGTLCIDDKWIKIAEITKTQTGKRKFGYAFFAIDPVTGDLVCVEVFDKNGSDSFKAFLLTLRADGIRPRRIITDLANGYSQVIEEVFGKKVLHHHCLFHFKQNIFDHLDKAFGRYSRIKNCPRRLLLKRQLQKLIFDVVDPKSRKTCRKRYENLQPIKQAYLSVWPKSKCVFNCLDRHFEKILNARENHKVVLTNNPAELLIRNFTQHYKTMAGFETIDSARNYLRVFQLVYRFSKFDSGIDDLNRRGKSPLSLAGYDNIEQMPFYRYLNQPLLENFIPSIAQPAELKQFCLQQKQSATLRG